MNQRDDKHVIVTGAAQGIGKKIAELFAEARAHVWLLDYNSSKGKQVEGDLQEKGYNVTFQQLDVQHPEEIKAFFLRLSGENAVINTLVNNAGISHFKRLSELEVTEWDTVMNTNVRSMMLMSKYCVPLMKLGGSIINIASTRALMSEPNCEAYAASKGAVIALTHALAATLSEKHIRVNAISPGWIQTENYSQLREEDHHQHFSQRVGQPADVAKACLFLSREDADFITGENVIIDGGMTRKMIYHH
ncbi:SDR family oxidoreductase [Salipaludibacillus agaradhaerens]|uniref:SDR family NAD(P)-dependent oxidoreductase n=1 Tax=Salipaludibacillus agaradhaerens TaxID=76935 RepID=UPI002151939A|nr:SDR family oxidoreductase [Salipaludibacillus agaradhaerens]MCR6106482.1 SDR family oxidoreductase [Salipaludibacillus agaradhaerens]MCR6118515.1 SDR family oxidoreductase [Salipaludibacillus agaradhaerens]